MNTKSHVSEEVQKLQFRIYALFLLADGAWTDAEQAHLKTIAERMELEESYKQEIFLLRYTIFDEGEAPEDEIACFATILKKIEQALDEGDAVCSWLTRGLEYDKRLQAETIWTLINLAYADRMYSQAERNIVRVLVKRWHLPTEIVDTFVDTMETMLLLKKQSEWLKTLPLSYDEISARLKKVDKQIQQLLHSAESTLTEINVMD